MLALVVCCLFAAILGFAAHRASVCTVRAVTELTSSRTGYMFLSIAKSSIWVLVVTLPFFWLMPAASAKLSGWRLTDMALLGGFIFGVGAGFNGACAYSTMARLWRTRPADSSLVRMILAPQYRLSTSAMVIGVSGSAIFLIFGSPGYTATLQNLIEGYIGVQSPPASERWVLLIAVFFGMAL